MSGRVYWFCEWGWETLRMVTQNLIVLANDEQAKWTTWNYCDLIFIHNRNIPSFVAFEGSFSHSRKMVKWMKWAMAKIPLRINTIDVNIHIYICYIALIDDLLVMVLFHKCHTLMYLAVCCHPTFADNYTLLSVYWRKLIAQIIHSQMVLNQFWQCQWISDNLFV